MASISTFPSSSLVRNHSSHIRSKICIQPTSRITMAKAMAVAEPIVRRSANYQPSLWSYDYIQSLTSKYTERQYVTRLHTLKEEVREMICERSKNLLSMLELVDDLQRLGISYHFEDEISLVLATIYDEYYKDEAKWNGMGLNLKALGFRLLRQHGYHIPQEIYHDIMDETGNLKACSYKDIVGMLNLYEASYLAVEDESLLDQTRDFTTKYLKENLEENKIVDESMSALVSHALELPLHWRVPRVETKWFIKVYEKTSRMNPTLIEFAKLDFNMVQAIYQEDLKYLSSWWRSTCWDKKLSFARDRLVENFLWTVGINYLPHFGHARRSLTKINSIITTIDDVYDVYGTLDELEKYTEVTNRWDVNALEELPYYMKVCFLGFYNSINEIAYNTLANEGFLSIPYLSKGWADLCNSYLVEARWYYKGYTPSLQEYLNNSTVSITGPVMLLDSFFSTSSSITEEALQHMENKENIVHYASLILRLADDLGTSSDELERGDVPKSIQCYMHESSANEEEARAYIKNMIAEAWKKLNKERQAAESPFSRAFIECATNLARMGQFMYSNGDGHGCPDVTKYHVLSLLINPIQ